MSKRRRFIKILTGIAVLIPSLAFVVIVAGPRFLQMYVENGIGDCRKIPILCMAPESKQIEPVINKDYLDEFIPHKFKKMEASVPKGFKVVQETVKRDYYKKFKRLNQGAVIYLLHEEPGFFINLFPQLEKEGVADNYEFMRRVMNARINGMKNMTDTFFVVYKSIFFPDLGDQLKARMIQVKIKDKRCFINYNLGQPGNLFDCNIISGIDGFFKIYIKDKAGKLDLDKVYAIIYSLVDTSDRNSLDFSSNVR